MELPLNYWAILLAALSNMGLGFLWYGPLFGKPWMELSGISHERIAEAQKKGMVKSYALMMLGAFLMAYVTAHIYLFGSTYLNSYGVLSGMTASFWNWVGLVFPVTISSVIWDGKPWKLWFINGGYYFVALLIMGAIIGGMGN